MSDQPAPSTNNFFQKIRVQNLLSFGPDSPEIELKPLNIIIGENGVGKSNLLTVFEFISMLPNFNSGHSFYRDIGGAKNFIWKGINFDNKRSELVFSVSLDARFSKFLENIYVFDYDKLSDRLIFVSELINMLTIGEVSPEEPLQVFKNNINEKDYVAITLIGLLNPETKKSSVGTVHFSHVKDEKFNSFNPSMSQVAETRLPHLNFMKFALSKDNLVVHKETDFAPSSVLRQAQEYQDFNYINSNFSNLFHHLLVYFREDLAYKREFIGYLRKFNPRFKDLSVNGLDTSRIKLFAEEEGLNSLIPVENISDGTLHFICLLAILLNPKPPKLVCIEEPENGLHPDAIHLVAELLKEASKRMQIIVTTHSADLVNYFTDTPEVIMVAEKGETGTEFKRLSNEDADLFSEHGLGNAWMMGLIGGVKK